MTERAAHLHPTAQQPRGGDPGLVDHVFPDVPVREWVLSVPHRIRYLLAWHHDLCKAVVGVLLGEGGRHLRQGRVLAALAKIIPAVADQEWPKLFNRYVTRINNLWQKLEQQYAEQLEASGSGPA